MKKVFLSFLPIFVPGIVLAIPIVGVDFSNDLGEVDVTPDDLNPNDSIMVATEWTFAAGNIATGDNNANVNRASAPVVKFDGPTTGAEVPAVGSVPPTEGVHSFSITIGAEPLDLSKVTFDFSRATGSTNVRWIAFRTSLDDGLLYSEDGPVRSAFNSVVIPLTDAKYQGLTNQTVDFFWYCGGEGSGDVDVDSIVIDGTITTDLDSDGMPDAFEQGIIDFDATDGITAIEDVLPGDDFDNDLSNNLEEFTRETSPVDDDSDDDGLKDGVETNDGTFDDLATDTGTDPRDDDSDDDGLKDGVETNDGTLDDPATDTGTNPLLADTDSDTIPDAYEVENSLDPNTRDGGADADGDGSTNLEEFTNGTFPNVKDSDMDGLEDGVESNSGTFVDGDDTGTDPLNPDTDGDLLLDGVESNDGSFNDATETGSNPLEANTDGDHFRDGAEVLIHGTDPTQAASQPNSTLSVLFLDGDGSGTMGADEIAVGLLQDKFGLDKVTVTAASAVVTGDETAFDLLVLSSTPGSGDIRGKFIDSTVPLVNWEEAVVDNSAGGEFGTSTVILSKSTSTTQILLGDHPIASGLPETVDLYDGANGETTSTPALFAGLTSVGTAIDGVGTGARVGESVVGQVMIIAVDAGDAVDDTVGTFGNAAPARRVMMPFSDNTLAFLSADGLALFSNALDWAVGNLGGMAGLEIVRFELDSFSDPGNKIATLEFTSRAGQDYTILSSSELSVFASGGGAEINTVTGTEGTTTVVLDFNTFRIPLSDKKRFFVVREGDEG